MTNTLKRTLSLLVALSMLTGLVAACGRATEGPSAGGAPSAGGREVIAFTWQGAEYGPIGEGEEATVVRYMEERFDIKVTPVYIEAATRVEQLSLLFASNEEPDVLPGFALTQYREWARQGLLAKISEEFIREKAPAIAADLDYWQGQTGENCFEIAKVDGVAYGIPFVSVDPTYPGPVIWRDDWLTNVGINGIPKTLDEFEDAFYKFANDDPDGNGQKDTYALSNTGLNAIFGTIGFHYLYWILKDGEIAFGGVQPEVREILALLAKWYKDGVLDPEYVTGENTGGYWALSHAFVNGRIGYSGMGSFYHWNPPLFEGQSPSTNYDGFTGLQPDGSYVFGAPPVNNGKSGMPVSSVCSLVTPVSSRLEKDSAKFDRYMEIQNAIADDYDLYVLVKNGFEGVQWNYNEAGLITPISDLAIQLVGYTIGAQNTFCKYQNMQFFKAMAPLNYQFADDTVGKYEKKYLNAVTAPLPSAPDYWTDLETQRAQTYTDIITGVSDISAFDTMVANWFKNGGEQLTKEANDVYFGR